MAYSLKKLKTILSPVLIAALLWLFGGGRVYAESRRAAASRPVAAPAALTESRFDSLLAEIKEVVREGGAKTKAAPAQGFAGISRLAALREGLTAENDRAQEYFSQLESFLRQKKLPAEILNRHAEFVREYQTKYDALTAQLDAIESAHSDATGFWGRVTGRGKRVNWDEVVGRTVNFLEANTAPARRRQFDPHNLPHRSLKADKPIPPKLTREEWLKAYPATPAGAGDPSAALAAKAGDALPLAATAPPVPEDLAETIEVKFTPEIRQLAESLGKNPVKIYNWVRNNVEFVPTWGSIQGAQLCLETKSCNAFDTASLLIAILRYSGVPARYQMGTIEVPVEKFKNWAGGFTSAEAAASLFASGGVPSVVRSINANGQVFSVRLEHLWVKAFSDYSPSGGSVNRQGDTWVELDPSFKQNSFTRGLDFESVVPSNTQSFIDRLVSGATIDPVTGSVTNLNSSIIRPFLQQVSDQRSNYIRSNLPGGTVGQAFGGRAVAAQSLPLLAATTPYRVLARAHGFAEIPTVLRHKVTVELRADSDVNLFSYTGNLPELAGKNTVLIYPPASPSDQETLASIAAAAFQNNQRLSVPSLIRLLPELYVGEQRVAAGPPLPANSPVVLSITFFSPTISTPAVSNSLTVGEAAAIGLDLQGISPNQAQGLGQKSRSIAERLQQGTAQGITNRDFAEVFLASKTLGWFALTDQINKHSAERAGVVTIRYPSAGLFFFNHRVNSIFRVPVSGTADSLDMDIDRDYIVSVARDGNNNKVLGLSFLQGAIGSALEADLPARMLSTPDRQVSGVATVQALRLANDQGVPIYHITASNAAGIIPLLQIDADDLATIQDAVNAGLEVTVSKTPVNFRSLRVLGIIVRDPLSTAASFLISGGTSGGKVDEEEFETAVVIWAGMAISFAAASFFLSLAFPPLGVALQLLTIFFLVIALYDFLVLTTQGPEAEVFNLTPCQLAVRIITDFLDILGLVLGARVGGATGGVIGFTISDFLGRIVGDLVQCPST